MEANPDMAGTRWLRDSVIYQIFLPSFADSDGDGIGDLKGAIAHLDHLEWLGIDAVWFNPCFVSPFRDAGYDVADYLTIAPRYGTNDDMAAFIAEAGRRGIRVFALEPTLGQSAAVTLPAEVASHK
jgi:glycosidase